MDAVSLQLERKDFERAVREGIPPHLGKRFVIRTPLIALSKAQIILKGVRMGVPYDETWSCYSPGNSDGNWIHCGRCDSCILRREGFKEAGVKDPTAYAN